MAACGSRGSEGRLVAAPHSFYRIRLPFQASELYLCMETARYKIIRMYFEGGRRTIKSNLTLEQAQAHCSDPETSSSTCCKSVNKRRTAQRGPWFDGYEQQ